MKMKTIQPYSNIQTIKALDCLEIDILTSYPSSLVDLNKLFAVGVRKNKKRIFLFVSKLLGKHIAVAPQVVSLGGMLLAECYQNWAWDKPLQQALLLELLENGITSNEAFEEAASKKYQLKEPTLFIGFAETATGLGHSMFSAFESHATYIHTTREAITSEAPYFCFEEEHSHATAHRCYAKNKDLFNEFSHIMLVDDEITTGNTALNLIEALYKQSNAKHYTVATLLDWRNEAQQQKAKALEEALGIQIDFISLVKGEMDYRLLKELREEDFETKVVLEPVTVSTIKETSAQFEEITLDLSPYVWKTTKAGDGKERSFAYMEATGRFGIDSYTNRIYEKRLMTLGAHLREKRRCKKTLCIGTEEFIYVPAYIARFMGEQIYYESTTRSPIMTAMKTGYPLKCGIAYKRPEDESVINYLYNVVPGQYEEVFWFFERPVPEGFKNMMKQALSEKGVKFIHFIYGARE